MHRQRQQRRTALGPPAISLFHYEEKLLFMDLLRLEKHAEYLLERQKINRRLELWWRAREASIPMYYRSQEQKTLLQLKQSLCQIFRLRIKKEHMLGICCLDRNTCEKHLHSSNTCLDLSTCYEFLLWEQEHLLELGTGTGKYVMNAVQAETLARTMNMNRNTC